MWKPTRNGVETADVTDVQTATCRGQGEGAPARRRGGRGGGVAMGLKSGQVMIQETAPMIRDLTG